MSNSINKTHDDMTKSYIFQKRVSNESQPARINSDEWWVAKRKAEAIVFNLSKEIETAIKNAKPQDRASLIAYRDSLADARADLNHGLVLSINEQWKSKQTLDNRKDPDPEPIADSKAYLDKYYAEQYKKWKK